MHNSLEWLSNLWGGTVTLAVLVTILNDLVNLLAMPEMVKAATFISVAVVTIFKVMKEYEEWRIKRKERKNLDKE